MRDLIDAIGTEAEREPGDPRGITAPGQLVAQQVGRQPRERKRRQKGHVVRHNRAAGHPDDRCGEHADADEMLGKRRAISCGIEERCMPPRFRERQRRRVPPQNPRVQQRVAEAAGKRRRQPTDEGISQREGERDVGQPRPHGVPSSHQHVEHYTLGIFAARMQEGESLPGEGKMCG